MSYFFAPQGSTSGDSSRPRIDSVAAILVVVLALFGFLGVVDDAWSSKTLTIYKNKLNTPDRRAEVTKYDNSGRSCSKKSKSAAVTIGVGGKTRECFLRIPVVGKNVEVSATGRLSKSTPKSIRGKTFLSLSVRQSPNGSRYQLIVFPAAKRFQLRKVAPNGKIDVLRGGKAGSAIKGVDRANRLTLRAFNRVGSSPASSARLVVAVNGKRLTTFDDAAGNSLAGRTATFSLGSSKIARGALGSFGSLAGRVPNPFG